MTTTLIMPTSAEITEIAKTYQDDLTLSNPIFAIFPIRQYDTALVMWEQESVTLGVQQARGLNGAPQPVDPLKLNQFQAKPGVYGEFAEINETDLTLRRVPGTFGTPINIEDLVMRRVRQLTAREIALIKVIGWNMLSGTYSVIGANNAVMATDSYTVQTYSAPVAWTSPGTARPLYDFQQVALKSFGYSLTFNSTADAWMSRITLNQMLLNTNSADLFGRRVAGLATANGLAGINGVLMEEDLPQIRIYEGGYYNSAGTAVRHLPAGKVGFVGKREDGAPLGEYQMVRNANNPDLGPGSYRIITDSATPGNPTPVPRTVRIDAGHNGGPALMFPEGIVWATMY